MSVWVCVFSFHVVNSDVQLRVEIMFSSIVSFLYIFSRSLFHPSIQFGYWILYAPCDISRICSSFVVTNELIFGERNSALTRRFNSILMLTVICVNRMKWERTILSVESIEYVENRTYCVYLSRKWLRWTTK